ncbi:MAG: DUF3429 domain-containing protein [Gammaproteobacteria bacterium]|nr:DUF3429 domain-containing protein [Gammaproteobacteria bacterium]
MRIISRGIIVGLGLLGLVPFLVILLPFFGMERLLSVSIPFLFTCYSATILSFLAGVLWGRVLADDDSLLTFFILIFSNAMALFSWAGLLLYEASRASSLLLLMLGYLFVLLAELRYRRRIFHELDSGYFRLRVLLTGTVLVLHVFALFLQ